MFKFMCRRKKSPILRLFKGPNSKVPNAILLDTCNKLDQGCMPINIGEFGDDPMKNVQVKEQINITCQIFTKSRVITQKYLIQFGR